MRKELRIKKSQEFSSIIQYKRFYSSPVMTLYVKPKALDQNRVGLSVGKKVGNAVIRNKVKRQLRSIISEKDYQNNFNCIIIVGRGINERNFII